VQADLLITGGTLVTEHDVLAADVAVRGGQIVALLEGGASGVQAEQVLDARGRYVLPGAVDCHVHFNEPGRTHWEGYATGTAAAAAGGITTVLDMPLNNQPPTLDAAALAIKRETVATHAVVDYGHWGGLVDGNLDALAGLVAGGVVAVKAFMCHSGLAEYPRADDAVLLEGMRRLAPHGTILGLHAESDCLTAAFGAHAQTRGHRAPRAWAEARPPFTEEEAVQRALLLARESGAAVHFVHISTPSAAAHVAAARAAGVNATLETCPHYLALDEDDLDRLGPIAKCAPPLRPRALVEALWRMVLAGQIDCLASDHSPCPPEDKARGQVDIWQAWGGIAGVQTMLPVLLTEGVMRRGLPLPHLVRLIAANPARRFGLYPRKGALRVGSDADLTVLNLEREWTLQPDDLRTRWPINPFIGRQLHGAVAATVVRGTIVYRDGEVTAAPGHGQLLLGSAGGGSLPGGREVSPVSLPFA
jgi:allantoinase